LLVSTQEVLGTQEKVQRMANLWYQNKEDLELIEQAQLLHFCNSQEFTAENLQYFKTGLYMLGSFLKACHEGSEELKKHKK